MATLNPNLLKQYAQAGFNFVLLHNAAFVSDRGRKLGKAARSKSWPVAEVSHQDAVHHMKKGGNIGVQMSTAGYLVVDYDPRADENAGTPENGLQRILDYIGVNIANTARVVTGNPEGKAKGQHIYLKVDPEWRGRTKLPKDSHPFPGVELKHSAGQYVVAAGSVHPGSDGLTQIGDLYRWHKDSVPLSQTAKAPEKLLKTFERVAPEKHMQGGGQDGWASYEADEIGRGLEFLDPTEFQDHEEWLTLMMSVHWASGGEAREEFVTWSTSDPAYSDAGDEIMYRWDTLSQKQGDRVDGLVRGGFFFKQLNERGCPPENYPRRRLEALFDDLTEADLILDIKEGEENPGQSVIKYMNERHAIVMDGRKSQYIRPSLYELSDYNDPQIIETFCDAKTLAEFYSNRKVEIQTPRGSKSMTWFEYWMQHENRRQYIGIEFRPGIDVPEREIEGQGIVYNSFRGWNFDRAERGPGDWKNMQRLIQDVIAGGNPRHYEYILNFMAYSIQHADRPQEVMMVVRGPKGVGKSIWAERWLRMFGSHGMATTRMDSLIGQFNSRVAKLCAVYIDEGMWGGDKQSEQHLKRLITQDTLDTEAKFMDKKSVRNYLTMIMTTNNDWAVPASIEERRFAVFDAYEAYPQRHPFFKKVIDEMDLNGGMQAMFYDLMHRDVRSFHPREVPNTKALRSQKLLSMGAEAQWWVDFLEQGGHPHMFTDNDTGAPPNWEDTGVYIPMKTLQANLKESDRRLPRDFDIRFEHAFGMFFERICPVTVRPRIKKALPERLALSEKIKVYSDGRCKCYWLPPLPDLKQFMYDNYGVAFEYEDGETGEIIEETKDPLEDLA